MAYTKYEVNAETGEEIITPLTTNEIIELEALQLRPSIITDPVEKLKQFLAANPDVAALI